MEKSLTLLANSNISDYLASVAAREPAPGGGAVAAVAAAEACALLAKVAHFSKGLDMEEIYEETVSEIDKLLTLGDKDSEIFLQVIKADRKTKNFEMLLIEAAKAPTEILEICSLQIPRLKTVIKTGNRNLITDLGIAAPLFGASIRSCLLNMDINMKGVKKIPAEITKAKEKAEVTLEELAHIAQMSQDAVS